jgi:hypothetical protein
MAMKRRRRPIARAADELMLHRVVMDIIEMVLQVGFVCDRVLPITPLPDASPLLAKARPIRLTYYITLAGLIGRQQGRLEPTHGLRGAADRRVVADEPGR